MNSLWKITIDDYLAVVKLAKENGVKPGESMEKYFVQYMKEKGLKPTCHTELSKDELISEYASHDKKTLDISTDNEGKSIFKIYKPKP